jgi:hypothetical protein
LGTRNSRRRQDCLGSGWCRNSFLKRDFGAVWASRIAVLDQVPSIGLLWRVERARRSGCTRIEPRSSSARTKACDRWEPAVLTARVRRKVDEHWRQLTSKEVEPGQPRRSEPQKLNENGVSYRFSLRADYPLRSCDTPTGTWAAAGNVQTAHVIVVSLPAPVPPRDRNGYRYRYTTPLFASRNRRAFLRVPATRPERPPAQFQLGL